MGAFGWLGLDGTYSRKQHRQGISALTGGKGSARPLGGRSGVTSPVTLSVSPTTWTVGSFTALLDLETDATMGVTAAVFDGDSTGSIDAASGSIIRWDLLYVTYDDASTTVPVVEYLAGTTASTLPATPSNSMALAKIVVPRSGTGSPSVQLIAPRASAAGGIGVYATSGDYPDVPYVGQYIDDASLGLLRWNGTAWQSFGKGGDTGWMPVTSLASGWAQDSVPMQARYVRGEVKLKGGLVNASFNSTTETAAAALPAGIPSPPDTHVLNIGNAGSTFTIGRAGRILTDGTIQLATAGATSIAYRIDGSPYMID